MYKALVTGSDGFIGSHLVESLVKEGIKVKAFCFYNSNNSWGWLDKVPQYIKKEIDVFLGDIRDPYCVEKAMRGCDTVFHLAALIGIPYSYLSPSSYVDTNIHGTLNILQSARELEVEKVVHTSTSETYGSAQFVPINESHPLVGQSPYAASKIGADQMALSYHKSFNTPISILRPFNTYGPRQSNRAVIPTIIKTVDLISEIMNVEIEVITENERIRPKNSEVNRLFGDNLLLKQLTNWEPKFSGIDGFKEGLKITIEWFSKQENLEMYKTNAFVV